MFSLRRVNCLITLETVMLLSRSEYWDRGDITLKVVPVTFGKVFWGIAHKFELRVYCIMRMNQHFYKGTLCIIHVNKICLRLFLIILTMYV